MKYESTPKGAQEIPAKASEYSVTVGAENVHEPRLAGVIPFPLVERRIVVCWDCHDAEFNDPHEAVDHAIRLEHRIVIDYSSRWEASR